MTDTATATVTPNKAGAKKTGAATKSKKPKTPSNHPKYAEMTVAAITALKERNGSSRQAILKYILGHYNVGKDPKVVNTHLKMALKRGATTGALKHSKGQGASGSFRVNSEKKSSSTVAIKKAAPAVKPKKVKKLSKVVEKPKKPKAKKATSVEKKKTAAKPKAKPKAKAPKIWVQTKSPKPKKAKSPKKAAAKKATAKPKKEKKSPKKATAKK